MWLKNMTGIERLHVQVHGEHVHAFPACALVQKKRKKVKSKRSFKLTKGRGENIRHFLTKRKRNKREKEREGGRERDYVKNSSERLFVGP